MPNAIDTLREALPEEHAYGDDDNGSPFHRDDCSLCALADVEALLQAADSREWCEGCRHGHGCYIREQQGISCTGRLAAAVRRVKGEAGA